MKITLEQIEQAHDYMYSHWIEVDEWSDFAVMDQAGDTELLSHALVQAGAIDSNLCYDNAKNIEQVIEILAKRFRRLSKKEQNKRYKEAFKDTIIVDCQDCNVVSFVHSGNEKVYPDLLKKCWECNSKKIETRKGLTK